MAIRLSPRKHKQISIGLTSLKGRYSMTPESGVRATQPDVPHDDLELAWSLDAGCRQPLPRLGSTSYPMQANRSAIAWCLEVKQPPRGHVRWPVMEGGKKE